MDYADEDRSGKANGGVAGGPGPDMKRGPGPFLMSAGTLVGNDVRNREGEDVGQIKEIMLDMVGGKVSYAVLSFGAFLGMGEKLFAVPWNALTLDTDDKCFLLNIERARLERAPGFHKHKWPNMADQAWVKEIHSYYGVEPTNTAGPLERQ
jgi:hypothetical protein